MTKEIRLNTFHMNAVGHTWPGLWSHPRDQTANYKDIEFWTSLAQLAERGKLDGVFLADTFGVQDVYQGSPAAVLKSGAQIPVNDPALVVPLMAAVTKHIGFGVTSSVAYEPPYVLARRFSTLDHLTKGRVAWNIVTGSLDSTARAVGHDAVEEHDLRYERASEYMEVVYKFWEGSWDDDAVRADRSTRIFADPDKVKPISHDGAFFKANGIHLCEPSLQRTPFLYQAGASSAGRQFAATHAEAIFMNGHSKALVARNVADLRRRAVEQGRDPYDIKVFLGASVVVAPTAAEARDRHEEYREHIDKLGLLGQYSARIGVDLAAYKPDEPLRYQKNNALHSAMEAMTRADPDRVWTVNDLTEFASVPSRGAFLVGSPGEIADELEGWLRDADVDGFNLARLVHPETLESFINLVVPELQNRGIYKTDYAEGRTLREKLTGSARLPATHPAAAARRSAA